MAMTPLPMPKWVRGMSLWQRAIVAAAEMKAAGVAIGYVGLARQMRSSIHQARSGVRSARDRGMFPFEITLDRAHPAWTREDTGLGDPAEKYTPMDLDVLAEIRAEKAAAKRAEPPSHALEYRHKTAYHVESHYTHTNRPRHRSN